VVALKKFAIYFDRLKLWGCGRQINKQKIKVYI
jgi:hypothetical protein